MDKENNRSAAGLRRSAIAERIRLREEWLELKGIENDPNKFQNRKKQGFRKVLSQKQEKMDNAKEVLARKALIEASRVPKLTSEALRGVVALVEVDAEPRALALRAGLSALGATVVPQWSPLVTHLVWAQGGSRTVRARARALACQLVSPLWVEACAAVARRLPERAFPAATRPSDLPSPRTLRALLRRAEMDNLTLEDLLASSKDDSDPKQSKLRLSSDTDHDSSADTSADKSTDVSTDKRDTIDIATRVNTALRRALPVSMTPPQEKKSRRKLFTHRPEGADASSQEESDEEEATKKSPKLTCSQRRDLARAERLARRLVGARSPRRPHPPASAIPAQPRVVLTGVSRSERRQLHAAIYALKGKVQREVTKKTTHVLLGSCQNDEQNPPAASSDVTGVESAGPYVSGTPLPTAVLRSSVAPPRTLNALRGAARGCRVLDARWVLDCQREGRWLHHHGYEVPHLKKICQKARVERAALRKLNSEYAYDVFSGMRVRLTPDVDQRDPARDLLNLCGATVLDAGDVGEADVTLGNTDGQVHSKWVFDSVAAGRMRTTRRYVVNSNSQGLSFSGR